MAQGVFDFQYEVDKRRGGMTGLAGLPPYLEFGYVMGLGAAIGRSSVNILDKLMFRAQM
ncbi:MAG: hypothetical protein V1897_09505 [Pseudomonadota bacterium]